MSKAKMMMPGKARGRTAIWQFPQPGVPTPRCQHEKKKKREGDGWRAGDERQGKRVGTDLGGINKGTDEDGRRGKIKGPSSFTVSPKSF